VLRRSKICYFIKIFLCFYGISPFICILHSNCPIYLQIGLWLSKREAEEIAGVRSYNL
jgi:hypothetical protein